MTPPETPKWLSRLSRKLKSTLKKSKFFRKPQHTFLTKSPTAEEFLLGNKRKLKILPKRSQHSFSNTIFAKTMLRPLRQDFLFFGQGLPQRCEKKPLNYSTVALCCLCFVFAVYTRQDLKDEVEGAFFFSLTGSSFCGLKNKITKFKISRLIINQKSVLFVTPI